MKRQGRRNWLPVSYQAVKRFVRHLRETQPIPFVRMEVEPGAEVQVDFGQGAWVVVDGKRKRPHFFRVVLSHSRKGYSEVVWRQTTECFIRCLENSFRHFGGVPRTLVIDNLRAAVTRADWYDPEINPKVEEFCRHYGTVIMPTRPAMPRHKGKVEAGVKYGQNNALKGRSFTSLAEQNLFLSDWERTVADTRIHGTTRQQVIKVFNEVERAKPEFTVAMLVECLGKRKLRAGQLEERCKRDGGATRPTFYRVFKEAKKGSANRRKLEGKVGSLKSLKTGFRDFRYVLVSYCFRI
jgi:transposase